jgi:cysteine desulfurase family protein (TIGR01976 family)
VYLDGPGGTQVPDSVIAAISGYLRAGGSNHDGPFVTSRYSDEVTEEARKAMADLFNASEPAEIAFGQNMTSLTLSVSRAISHTWRSGDEVVVTRLDHDANVWPWVIAARERGVTVRFADFDPATGVLSPDAVREVITDRTRLVAVSHASNAIGSIVDVAEVTAAAHEAGALAYVDAVHYTPHGIVDVQAVDADFLVASAYKFFGPHTGVLYGKRNWLESIEAVKIRPAPADPPGKWETGTQSFESLAGVTAAVDYLASLGTGTDRREALESGMGAIVTYEQVLSARFLAGVAETPGIELFGVPSPDGRTPTFAVSVAGVAPDEVAARLGAIGIFVWSGHYYAVEVMTRLGVIDDGGLVRIGFVHYTTPEEVDLVVDALAAIADGRSVAGINPAI